MFALWFPSNIHHYCVQVVPSTRENPMARKKQSKQTLALDEIESTTLSHLAIFVNAERAALAKAWL